MAVMTNAVSTMRNLCVVDANVVYVYTYIEFDYQCQSVLMAQ